MQENNNYHAHKFWAFLTGTLFGAGLVMLSDQNKRSYIRDKLDQLLGQVEEVKQKGKTKLKKELQKAEKKLK